VWEAWPVTRIAFIPEGWRCRANRLPMPAVYFFEGTRTHHESLWLDVLWKRGTGNRYPARGPHHRCGVRL